MCSELTNNQEKKMSIKSVKAEIGNALNNGRINKAEAQKIVREAEKDNKVSKGEYLAIVDASTKEISTPAKRVFDEFFTRQNPIRCGQGTTGAPPVQGGSSVNGYWEVTKGEKPIFHARSTV
jgi:hypothetical protein